MLPVLFKVFGFEVHSYGVMIVAAFLVAVWFVRRRAAAYGIDKQKLTDGLIVTLIVGILGARVAYILQELPYYEAHPRQIFSPQMAGITSFGAIVAGLGYLFFWAKRRGIHPLSLFDCIGPPFLVGNAIGRIGCLLNGCCYGGICSTTLPWKIHVADSPGTWHHPAQIYDSLLDLLAFGIVIALERRNTGRGQSFGLAMMGYGGARFIYEFWRAGTDAQVASGAASSTYWIGWLTQAQAVAGAMILAGAAVYTLCRKWTPPTVESPVTSH
ncbi:MAG TPA: prolipoprotein diacylglyceryl transferase [Fimbriimonadaceae bacterium]|nr:prolipoprotein diacylglyceryl transferase [Fimbriimonadaceae bacterium]